MSARSERQLESVPRWTDSAAEAWVSRVPARADSVSRVHHLHSVSGSDLPPLHAPSSVARFGCSIFQRFVLAVLAADLAVYESPADVVDIERLAYVVAKFPAGFRLWYALDKEGCVPVGYSGYYPISASSFDRMETGIPALEDRFLHPIRLLTNPFLYIFNYSIAPELRSSGGGTGGKRLVQQLSGELWSLKPQGLAAITVSADGSRIAERWGLKVGGSFEFEGEREYAYTWRASTSVPPMKT